jgi:hypothetical protein
MLAQHDRRIESLEQRRANILAGLQPFPSATDIVRANWATMRAADATDERGATQVRSRISGIPLGRARSRTRVFGTGTKGMGKPARQRIEKLARGKNEEMEQLDSMLGLLKATAEPIREGLSEFVTEDELIAFGEEAAA